MLTLLFVLRNKRVACPIPFGAVEVPTAICAGVPKPVTNVNIQANGTNVPELIVVNVYVPVDAAERLFIVKAVILPGAGGDKVGILYAIYF